MISSAQTRLFYVGGCYLTLHVSFLGFFLAEKLRVLKSLKTFYLTETSLPPFCQGSYLESRWHVYMKDQRVIDILKYFKSLG